MVKVVNAMRPIVETAVEGTKGSRCRGSGEARFGACYVKLKSERSSIHRMPMA